MTEQTLIRAAEVLAGEADQISFTDAAYIYNPLTYAKEPHDRYVSRFARGKKRVLFLGMNPGPWGMAQTGVPFGEIRAVKEWMHIEGKVEKPQREHPKKPVEGFSCPRSEVSGRRLWGLMQERYPDPRVFFRDHFVVNYCPLVFMDDRGRNLTPDKLSAFPRRELESACLDHLITVIETLAPSYLIGVGVYAEQRLREAASRIGGSFRVMKILHPSPASPLANRGWDSQASAQLCAGGVWEQ